MKMDVIEIAGQRCSVFTEHRSVRVGNAGRATRRTLVTILCGGRQIASASTRPTAIQRAQRVLDAHARSTHERV